MKNSFSVILLFVVVSLLGLLAITRLNVRLDSKKYGNTIQISFAWPNSSPEAVERQVITPLEGVVSTLQGVTKIESFSSYHRGLLIVSVENGKKLEKMRFEIASKIRQIYRLLPAGVTYPTLEINASNSQVSQQPIMVLQINSQDPPDRLLSYTERTLKPLLMNVNHIHSIEIHGGQPQELNIEFNQQRTEILGITKRDIIEALEKNGKQGSLGNIQSPSGELQSVSFESQSDSLKLESIPIQKVNNKIIYLGEIATIKKVGKRASSFFRINGKNAMEIALFAENAANPLELSKSVFGVVKDLSRSLPPGYKLVIDYDATEKIREKLSTVLLRTVLVIFLLSILLIVFERNFRVVFIVVSGLVSCLLISSILLYIFSIDLHEYAITAIPISLTISVINLYTMFDYYRKVNSRNIIAIQLGYTMFTIVAISAIWLLPPEIRIDLSDFSIPLIVLPISSLLVSFWLIPALIERFLPSSPISNNSTEQPPSYCSRLCIIILSILQRLRPILITLSFVIFGLPFFMMPQKLDETSRFAGVYNKVFGNYWFLDNIKPVIDKGLGGTLRLFSEYVFERSVYQSNERTALHIEAGMPNHSTVEQMDDAIKRIERELTLHYEIDRFITHVKNGQQAAVTVFFKKQYDRGLFPHILKGKIASATNEMSGIDWNIYGIGQGYNQNFNETNTPSFNILVKGYNYSDLANIVAKIHKVISDYPRTENVDINRTPGTFKQKELNILSMRPNFVYWTDLGVSPPDLFSHIESRDARPRPDLAILTENNYIEITVQPKNDGYFDVFSLREFPFITNDGTPIKIGKQVEILKTSIIPTIRKVDQQYLRQISFEYLGSPTYGHKFLDQTIARFKSELPLGYTIEKQVFGWTRDDSENHYGLIALLMLVMFVIGAAMFESFQQPFSLILCILFSFIGVFLSFYWTDVAFDQGGYAAFFFLCGIISIPVTVLISEFNQLKKETDLISAALYYKVLVVRARIIFFILVAITIGLLPSLILEAGEPFWHALSIGTLGGIFVFPFIMMLIIPLFLLKEP